MVLKLIKLFLQLFEEKYRDVIDDPRTELEKAKDYIYGEDVVLPRGETGKRIKKLPIAPYNQQGTSACGAFSAAHMRLITEGKTTFPPLWYRDRSNFSGPGMFLKDVLKQAAKANEVRFNGQVPARMTEAWANNLSRVELYGNRDDKYEYTRINPYDADAVFDAVSNGYATLISFYCTKNEWDFEVYERDFVLLTTAAVRHYVVAIPNSNHIKDGHEWITVVDSAWAKNTSIRHIRKDFLAKRMYHGGGFYYEAKTKKKKVTAIPTVPVRSGQRSEDVRKLQTFLYELGFLSNLHITGFYGNITSAAVLRWQLLYITEVTPLELQTLAGRHWGPASIRKANELYR